MRVSRGAFPLPHSYTLHTLPPLAYPCDITRSSLRGACPPGDLKPQPCNKDVTPHRVLVKGAAGPVARTHPRTKTGSPPRAAATVPTTPSGLNPVTRLRDQKPAQKLHGEVDPEAATSTRSHEAFARLLTLLADETLAGADESCRPRGPIFLRFAFMVSEAWPPRPVLLSPPAMDPAWLGEG